MANPFLKQYLMTAGPTPIPPAVSEAMAQPVLYHRAPAFIEVYARCLEEAEPATDVRASAEYRRHLVPILVERALGELARRRR